MKRFRYAVSSAAYAPSTAPLLLIGDIHDNFKDAKAFGYDALEIHMRETDTLDIPSVLRTMEQTGMKVSMIATGRLTTEGGCSLIDDRPYVMQAAMEGTQKYIDIASALGADLIVGWLIGNIPAGKLCPRQYMDRLAENLRLLCNYAAPKNVRINVEIINHYEVNVFTTVKSFMDFKNEYGLENLYAHLDTFHMNIDENSFEEAIRLAGRHIGYVHVADNHRQYPGSGMLDFKQILTILEDINYDGYLSVECFPVPDGKEAARKAVEYLKSLET